MHFRLPISPYVNGTADLDCSLDQRTRSHDIKTPAMENLSISDPPLPGGGGSAPPPLGAQARPPPPQQQLPAQMFTTAAQLLDLTDSKNALVITGLSRWKEGEKGGSACSLRLDVSVLMRAGLQKSSWWPYVMGEN